MGTSPKMIAALRSKWGAIAKNDIRIIIGSMFCQYLACVEAKILITHSVTFEARHERSNVLVSDLVRHKRVCTATEDA